MKTLQRAAAIPRIRLDSRDFRRIMSHWASSVGVVTSRTPAGDPRGFTANAITSLSLEPLLVLICVAKTSDTHDCIRASRAFAINFLTSDQQSVAARFATSDAERKFEGIAHHNEQTGSPVLDDALAWIDCRLHSEYEGGDHTIFVGEVAAGDTTESTPLLYYRGAYAHLTGDALAVSKAALPAT